MASDLCRILGTFQPDLAHYRETVTSRGTKLNALARIIGNSAQLGKYPVFQAAFVTTEAPKDAPPGLGHDFFDSIIVLEYATIFRPPRPHRKTARHHQGRPGNVARCAPMPPNSAIVAPQATHGANRSRPNAPRAAMISVTMSGNAWCPRRDSNSQALRRRFLKPLRLPFRHSGRARVAFLAPCPRQGKSRPKAYARRRCRRR